MIPYAPGYEKNDEPENGEQFDYMNEKKIRWQDRILLNRPLKYMTCFALITVLIPLLLYRFLYFTSEEQQPSDGLSIGSCILRREIRIPCGIHEVNSTDCHPACCYDNNSHRCYHRLPSRFSYITDGTWTEGSVFWPRMNTVPFKDEASTKSVRLSFDEISPTHLAITFYNADEIDLYGKRLDKKNYTYTVRPKELNVEVKGPNGVIFNTDRGPLIAAENIWEVAIKLTNETMFGLGEIPLMDGMVKLIYSNDKFVYSVPLIIAKINETYHGLLIDTSTPTEIRVIGNNRITVRSITNLGLKFHVFVGPKPKDIMDDVIKLIGHKEFDYWMLGAHICSYVSNTPDEKYNDVIAFIGDATSTGLPYESHCGVSPLMFEDDCYNELVTQANNAANFIKNSGRKYLPHVLPYIHYEEVIVEDNDKEDFETDLERNNRIDEYEDVCSLVTDFEEYILQDDNQKLYQGSVGLVNVIYPDYSNVTEEIMRRLWVFQDGDGYVLENSWPADESVQYVNETRFYLPYFSKDFEEAFEKTPQWNASYTNGEKYLYTHNQYGQNFAAAMKNISNPNSLIWSSSQWMSGKVGVNRQNVVTSWTSFRNELVEAALGGISGQWLWSSPICGDTDNYNATVHETLCLKWYLAATYFPMIKIHSTETPRDPLAFTGTYRRLIVDALQKRLSMMPYFYTTLQEGPLLRPMFYQFPSSAAILNLKYQFSVGDFLLIVPNITPDLPFVHFWLPPGMWFELWSGLLIEGKEGDAVTMTTLESDFVTLIQGGSIIVTQQDVRVTAEETRQMSDYTLTVALHCDKVVTVDPFDLITEITTIECHAKGKLFLSKNLTVNFEADGNKLSVTAEGDDFDSICGTTAFSSNRIAVIKVYGLSHELNNFDTFRLNEVAINMCDLKEENVINISYIT